MRKGLKYLQYVLRLATRPPRTIEEQWWWAIK